MSWIDALGALDEREGWAIGSLIDGLDWLADRLDEYRVQHESTWAAPAVWEQRPVNGPARPFLPIDPEVLDWPDPLPALTGPDRENRVIDAGEAAVSWLPRRLRSEDVPDTSPRWIHAARLLVPRRSLSEQFAEGPGPATSERLLASAVDQARYHAAVRLSQRRHHELTSIVAAARRPPRPTLTDDAATIEATAAHRRLEDAHASFYVLQRLVEQRQADHERLRSATAHAFDEPSDPNEPALPQPLASARSRRERMAAVLRLAQVPMPGWLIAEVAAHLWNDPFPASAFGPLRRQLRQAARPTPEPESPVPLLDTADRPKRGWWVASPSTHVGSWLDGLLPLPERVGRSEDQMASIYRTEHAWHLDAIEPMALLNIAFDHRLGLATPAPLRQRAIDAAATALEVHQPDGDDRHGVSDWAAAVRRALPDPLRFDAWQHADAARTSVRWQFEGADS